MATPGPDRRRLSRQEPKTDGRRASDPTLTTRDCADRLGVSPGFILGEIHDGRLQAHVLTREGRRAIYRVSPAALQAYQAAYWRRARRATGTG